jgi:hypothetical protein
MDHDRLVRARNRVLGVGFARRPPLTHWLGLAVLAAAAVRVFAYDVWRLERHYRIVSSIALGGAIVGYVICVPAGVVTAAKAVSVVTTQQSLPFARQRLSN